MEYGNGVHPINSLEAFSFKKISDEVKRKVNSLFGNGFTPSQAYNRFLMNSKNNYNNELNFHLQKTDGSKSRRRRDFNYLYVKYFQEHFGMGNDPEMFSNLQQRN